MMGKLQMDREWTEQDLRTFAEGAQAAFETVLLDELPQDTGWQDEGLQVSYSLCNGRVSCVLHRTVRADGKLWQITMSAPLAGNLLPEERMSARERELCREDMSHDFLTCVYNRRYLETVFAQKLEQCAAQGRKAAVALVSIDNGQKLRDTYGQPVMDQLHCFVGNQWKKSFDTPAARVVCRLTGTKRGCDIGECGACTVLLDDRAVTSCMVMAGQVQGRRVVTIEGLTGHDGALSPLQQAFVDHFAVQCGFCTPGMIMSATALLHEDPHPSREKIRRAISGNLCRCTGYDAIVDAIDAAAAEMSKLV